MLAVYVAYWILGDRTKQNGLLVLASAVFYGWIHPWFLILLYASAIIDYCMGRAIERWRPRRRLFLATSMLANMGMLGFFKYYNFFVENATATLGSLGLPANFSTLSIILPVGISFYTFQTMSYTIDVYRGQVKARSNFLDYLVYVTFFPQLVAGPIERAGNLLPQVEKARVFNLGDLREGFGLAMWGAFKKVVIADTLAPYVDKVYILNEPSGPLIWAATFAFTIQILADFSGYTDMARGTARMLGFKLVKNFNHPYMATSTPDFWRRWHMSLSFWIRDYLLVPLLGDARNISLARFMWATTLSFLLLGLWHGASWNFILLGLWNAMWMIIYPGLSRVIPAKVQSAPGARWVAIAFFWAVPGSMMSLMFRETRLHRIIQHLSQNPFATTRDQWICAVAVLAVTLVACLPLLIALIAETSIKPRLEKTVWRLPVQTALWSFFIVSMFIFYRVTTRDFIYFQF
jgi:D-alanyl-lipoteichoic acid acyltransferase DltB (MBOAT superfamily)